MPPGSLPWWQRLFSRAQVLPLDLRFTLDVDGAPLVLALDRNTLVYLPTGLSTVSELRPGEVVRAGRNGHGVAYWVQVRSPPAGGAPTSTPGQGTGPGGGTPPPAESPAAPAPSTPTGGVPSGSSPGRE